MKHLITVGVDGSRASLDAADWAAREAALRGLPLRLLHADEATAHPTHRPAPQALAGRVRTALDRVALGLSYAHPGLEIHAGQEAGAPVEVLAEAALGSDTLVLGSRGLSGVAAFLAGSVASGVTARAERPVVLVRSGELPEDAHLLGADGAPSRRTPYRPVVLGLDVDRPSEDVLAYAFEAAALRGAPLHVVHAWTLPPLSSRTPGFVVPAEPAELQTNTQDTLATILQPWRRKYPDTPVTEHVVYGRAGHELLKAATAGCLLVIGRSMPAGPRLGRTAQSVIHHVVCPVAVIPHH
ncbi:universal stress protein [Streptomyces sp. TRM66268-LWL]|uniref:Universal stress protein n=1 Tax=Streptomyces polyasparticus TaxID=2767826 RepID=A0ABR7SLT8_9ACTN|nr:universal stress protein [Streptomyces polyasparticus]MBC9715328.1 universal stress protein [Streptomyces polyasparticus]